MTPLLLVVALTMCDSDQVECGPGTEEVSYECLPLPADGGGAPGGGSAGPECGPGTIEVDGLCVPEPVEPITPSASDMAAYACDLGSCDAARVVEYWTAVITEPPYDETTWEDHDIERTIAFEDDFDGANMNYRFVITDTVTGDPADLTFEAGIPVTLHLVNPTVGAHLRHFFTSPAYFRTVAWRMAETSDAQYRAYTYDGFFLQFSSLAEKSVTLYFVPIETSAHDAYCQLGVVNGSAYKEIVDGTVTPDLLTGHAGKGMKTTMSTVDPDGLGLAVFQGELARSVEENDPRRNGLDPVWTGTTGDDGVPCTEDNNELVACQGVTMTEVTDEVFQYSPTSLTFSADTPVIVRLTNPPGNGRHYLTGPHFFKDCVLRKAQDTQIEVHTPYLSSVEMMSPTTHTAELWIVPTVIDTYTNYCQNGVQHSNGAPNLSTGHAGMGMQLPITVQ